jgi:hypothetical protein
LACLPEHCKRIQMGNLDFEWNIEFHCRSLPVHYGIWTRALILESVLDTDFEAAQVGFLW